MTFDPNEAKSIFLQAADLPTAEERAAFVEQSCNDRPELKARVVSLLRTAFEPDSLLDQPADELLATRLSSEEVPGIAETPEIPLDFFAPSSQPGSIGVLAHYEVKSVLGQGAFGIVFKAFDEKLHRMVAIKVMNPALAATSPPRKRFLREARSSASVRHENIVAIHAVEEQPVPYLVMEYIPGKTLQQWLDEHGPLDAVDVLKFGQQIAAGLAAAHAQGLIHRDIKPANILIDTSIEARIKISDFGLARAVDDASMTQSGLIAGTPMYMAPEQARGQTLDHRADLFSLGSVLYTMASGRPPFRAANTIAVLKRVCEDTPRPISEVIPGAPAWLDTLIGKLHAKEPEDRFQSAKEVADLLGKCAAELQSTGRVMCVEQAVPPHSAASGTTAAASATAAWPLVYDAKRFRFMYWVSIAAGLSTILPGMFDTWPRELQFLPGAMVCSVIVLLVLLNDWHRKRGGTDPDSKRSRSVIWASLIGIVLANITAELFDFGLGIRSVSIFVAVFALVWLFEWRRLRRLQGQPVAGSGSQPETPSQASSRPLGDSLPQPVPRTLSEALWAGAVAKYSKLPPEELERLRKRKRRTALMLSLLVMFVSTSTFLAAKFGRHFNAWIWPAIPTLPTVAAAQERLAGLRFDGQDDFIQIPVKWDSQVLTIEAFVTSDENWKDATVWQLSNEERGDKEEQFNLFEVPKHERGSQSFAGITGVNGYLNALAPLLRGRREHRAVVFDGDELHYYVNGIWQGKRRNQSRDKLQWRMKQLTIGCGLNRTQFFRGTIDQLRVSKVARYLNNFPPVSHVAVDDATLALYNFDEGAGEVLKDASGNENHGKIFGGEWGHPAKGLQFDGVDDYVEFNGLGWASNQYTFEAYISQDGGHGNIFQAEGLGGMLHMYLNPHAGGVGINRGSGYQNVNGPRPSTIRQHLAVVYDGQNLSYFVQGQLAGTKTKASIQVNPMRLDRMMIGAKLQSDPSKPEFFEGRLEQLRVSKTVRYTVPFTPAHELAADDATLALYNFDIGQGEVIKDVSGRSPEGKIFGATWVNPASLTARP